MVPVTPFRADQYLSQGLSAAAQAMQDYQKTQQQTALQQGFVEQAVQMGMLEPEKLAAFSKGSLNQRLQIGSEAALALKMALEQQQIGIQQQGVDNDAARVGVEASRLTENRRQFDAELKQRQEEMKARGTVNVTSAPGQPTVVSNPGTGQFQLFAPPDMTSADPTQLIVRKDPTTGGNFLWTGKGWRQVEPSLLDQLANAGLLNTGGARPGGVAPNPPMPPAPGGGGNLPTVRTDADFNALPSGAMFLDPQGNVRQKP